jgi:acetoacetyl-CoA synthetase
MMWNLIVGGPLVGVRQSCTTGIQASPTWTSYGDWLRTPAPRHSAQRRVPDDLPQERAHPGQRFDLSSIECIASTGSPLPPEAFAWVYQAIRRDT